MPTADMVRTPGTFGISAWLRRSEARRHPRCRGERTGRDPRPGKRRGHASPCPGRRVAAGEGLGSCHSSGRATFPPRGRARRGSPLSHPGYPSVSRGWPASITANAHLCPLPPLLAEPLLAATRAGPVRPYRVTKPRALTMDVNRQAHLRVIRLPNGCAGGRCPQAAVYGVRPRIRPIRRADSSDFGRNPAAGLSAISSV